MDSDLKKIIHGQPQQDLDEPRIRHFMHQLLTGLLALKQRDILHRDLKPENLFVDAHDNLKIGDFGLARNCGSVMNAPSDVIDHFGDFSGIEKTLEVLFSILPPNMHTSADTRSKTPTPY